MHLASRLLGVLLLAAEARGCTVIAASASATADGSVLVTHSDDAEGSGDPRVYRVPAAYHGHGGERPILANAQDFRKPEVIGSIPQAEQTYAYYRTGFGMLNEKQLVLGESTTSSISKPNDAKPVHKGGKALIGVQEMTMLVMERCATARCAVQTAGNLTEKYGFYQDADTPTGEALALGDPRDVWVFHVLPDSTGGSSVWAAARVPDGHVTSIANMFMIRELDLSDTDNFLASKNIEAEAERSGRWSKQSGKPIDFTLVFSDGEYMAKHYSGRRVWRAFSLLAPDAGIPADYGDMRVDAPYPFSIPAGVKVSPQLLMRIHRDYYAGTPYDLTQGLAAGPWGTPNRWSMPGAALGATWERPISIYRQDLSYIAQARHWLPDECGGTLWFGPHNAQGTVYFPLPIGADQVPAELGSFAMGSGAVDRSGAFWAFSAVQQLADSRFAWISKEVEAMQSLLESDMPALQASADAAYVQHKDKGALTAPIAAKAKAVTERWWLFLDELLFRYADGYIHATHGDELATPFGYPHGWLKGIGYDSIPQDHGAPCVAAGTPCSALSPPAEPLIADLQPDLQPQKLVAQLDRSIAPKPLVLRSVPQLQAAHTLDAAPAAAAPASEQPESGGTSPFALAVLVCAALMAGFAGGLTFSRRQVQADAADPYLTFGVYQRAATAAGEVA